MEILSSKWISELEMEDPSFFPQLPTVDYSFDDTNFQSFSSESYSSYPNIGQKISQNDVSCNNIEAYRQEDNEFTRPMKQLKTNNWSFSLNQNIPPKVPSSSSPYSQIISFNNSDSPPAVSQQHYGLDCDVKPNNNEVSKRVVRSLTRTPLHAQDHVIAERKRREKLSQRFISLSALIPGLKKTDKASVLGDAIKYLKQLQEKVTTLEEQVAKKAVESVIFLKKTQIYADDETSSSGENFESQFNKPFPEIEARVSDKDVLIRIHCENRKGFISNIIKEVEKLHLSVLNTKVFPFGQATLDITIVSQMEAELSMTVKDLVKTLRLALMKFM
ncbi:putative Mitochondrial editing factor 22 [Hibiscus syriacus]|uniref:Mitochondrial editing factor 22 n=1 Tax=Hibiscus syriacus TaxID=106335 RepID=A0A6A2ZR75_HIBSY|nr:putative Mitochondrial editing factor 22 [Hibiscus syriacus]